MNYTSNKISTFVQDYTLELYGYVIESIDSKNITCDVRNIVSFYNKYKEKVLYFDPHLEDIFDITIGTFKQAENKRYAMSKECFIFLIINYVLFNKYSIIQYTKQKVKELDYDTVNQYVREFQDILYVVIKKGEIQLEDIQSYVDDSTELFREFISQYPHMSLDKYIELGKLIMELNEALDSNIGDSKELIPLIEKVEKQLTTVKKILIDPPKIME